MNSNILSYTRQHQLPQDIDGNRQKEQAATCSQEQDPVNQNQPFLLDGMFWNVNHSYKIKPNFSCPMFAQLNMGFESQIFSKHLSVVKICCKKYIQNILGSSYENHDPILQEMNDYAFERPRNWHHVCQAFLNYLSHEHILPPHHIKCLASYFDKDPLLLNIFQILGKPVPSSFKADFYLLLFMGIQVSETFKELSPFDEATAMFLVNQKVEELTDLRLKFEDHQSFKDFSQIIIYTAVVAGLGKGQNIFYNKLTKQLFHSLEEPSTIFERHFSQLDKNRTRKVKTVRRNVLGRNMNEGTPKKRVNSNQ